jgi:hypothetical protein
MVSLFSWLGVFCFAQNVNIPDQASLLCEESIFDPIPFSFPYNEGFPLFMLFDLAFFRAEFQQTI